MGAHADVCEPFPLPERASPAGRMPLVYIAGPIRRGCIWANVAQADLAMRELMVAGMAVINPMLSCWAGAGEVRASAPHPLAHGQYQGLGAEPWLTMDLEIVSRCDAVLRLPGDSSGADGETAHARALGIPVFDSVEAVVAWAGGRP